MSETTFALIGPGRVGRSIAYRLVQDGYHLSAIISRSLSRAKEAATFVGATGCASCDLSAVTHADIVLLAVADDQIATVAEELAARKIIKTETLLVHFSGLHPAVILRPKGGLGRVASIHHLLSFAEPERAVVALSGTPCAIEGDAAALAEAETLVRAWGGEPFRLASEHKGLYHAAACVASNFQVTLAALARDLLAPCGLDAEAARALLLPIQQATSANLAQLPPESALTGPIVRGDFGTVQAHLHALTQTVPQALSLYRQLGLATVALAETSGRLPADAARRLRQELSTDAP
ncbi:MAG: DUF2520 domain-containing protein [Desulfuromonas sp.]|nr:MAG: DUF2520 domain-containing protein [Desulfuromonas sp.]